MRNSRGNMMESENQQMTEELGRKGERLKQLVLDLEKDAKDQNKYADTLTFDFNSAGNLIKTSVTRIGGVMQSAKTDRKVMFYLIIGLVICFFLLYKMLSYISA